MIKKLSLKFGRAPGLPPETIPTTPVTVFVGPNNSGKSKVLAEIYQYCISGQRNVSNVIVEQIGFESFSRESAEERIQHVTLRPHTNETLQPNRIIVGKRGQRNLVSKEELVNSFLDTNAQAPYFCSWYLAYNTLILDGQSRISLINDQNAGDLQQVPQTSFQVLFHDNEKRAEVRRIVHDAFDAYLVVDPTKLGMLRLRLSPKAPVSESQERGIHEESVQFHGAALPIQETSDGVKAFAGMITEIIAGDPAILLIDEPEAFLHPASVVAWIGAEMEFALSQAVASGDTFEHRPPECGHCVQDFLADLDLRDLPGEAAGSESGADDALPPADLRFYPAALVVPCGRLPGHAAVAADLGNMAIPNGWIPRRLRSDHCVLWRRYNHIQGLPIPLPQHIPYRRSIIGAVSQKARDRSIELIQEPG